MSSAGQSQTIKLMGLDASLDAALSQFSNNTKKVTLLDYYLAEQKLKPASSWISCCKSPKI